MRRPGGLLGELFSLRVLVIVGVIALIAYAIFYGSSGDSDNTKVTTLTVTPGPTVSFPPAAQFVSPLDGAQVANPIAVRMAVGGVLFSPASEPAAPGKGHLGVIIDGDAPPAGQQFIADATHIDLTDASYTLTLPTLSPGQHRLTVVFLDSNSAVTAPIISQSITVTVTS